MLWTQRIPLESLALPSELRPRTLETSSTYSLPRGRGASPTTPRDAMEDEVVGSRPDASLLSTMTQGACCCPSFGRYRMISSYSRQTRTIYWVTKTCERNHLDGSLCQRSVPRKYS